MERVQNVALASAGVLQLTDGSLLSGNTPLAWNLDVETFAENLQVPQLIHVQPGARHDLVVLQRIGQSRIAFAERFASLQDIDLSLYQQHQQEQVDLIGHQTVDGRCQMLVHASGRGMMIQQRREQLDQFVLLQSATDQVFGSAPLHQAHGQQVGFADKLHEVGRFDGT